MDSSALYRKANSLVRQCGTRDLEKIASEIGIHIYPMEAKALLGIYTFCWNHRMIIIATLDDGNGMLFNNRKQSQDRVLREKVLTLTAGSRL